MMKTKGNGMSFKEYTVKVYDDGHKVWYRNGNLHREDGPAVEWVDGNKSWYLNGNLHREDGPAIEYANGSKVWYLNGELHREDGPAIEYANGTKAWYLNNKPYTEAGFKAKMAPAKEMTIAEIEKLLGYRLKIVKE
jgi:hypothetical protein